MCRHRMCMSSHLWVESAFVRSFELQHFDLHCVCVCCVPCALARCVICAYVRETRVRCRQISAGNTNNKISTNSQLNAGVRTIPVSFRFAHSHWSECTSAPYPELPNSILFHSPLADLARILCATPFDDTLYSFALDTCANCCCHFVWMRSHYARTLTTVVASITVFVCVFILLFWNSIPAKRKTKKYK